MDLSNTATAIIAFLGPILAAYITVRVFMAEVKKDVAYMKDELTELKQRREKDMETVMADIKDIKDVMTEIRVNLAGSMGCSNFKTKGGKNE